MSLDLVLYVQVIKMNSILESISGMSLDLALYVQVIKMIPNTELPTIRETSNAVLYLQCNNWILSVINVF